MPPSAAPENRTRREVLIRLLRSPDRRAAFACAPSDSNRNCAGFGPAASAGWARCALGTGLGNRTLLRRFVRPLASPAALVPRGQGSRSRTCHHRLPTPGAHLAQFPCLRARGVAPRCFWVMNPACKLFHSPAALSSRIELETRVSETRRRIQRREQSATLEGVEPSSLAS